MLISLVKSSFGTFVKEVYTTAEFFAYCEDRRATTDWAKLFDAEGNEVESFMGDLRNE